MTKQISRRAILKRVGTALGGIAVLDGHVLTSKSTNSDIKGWVTKGSKVEIAGETAVIETIEDPGTTMCNSGELYQFQTCAGNEGYLLVGFGTPQPSVGAEYQFVPTNEENWCQNFKVELQSGVSCDDGPRTDEAGGDEDEPPNEHERSAETATETAETVEPNSETETPTESDSEPPTETTTEATAEPPTETTTESPSDPTTETIPEPSPERAADMTTRTDTKNLGETIVEE